MLHCYPSCRWASVGAFYPFSRNHYAYNTRSHEFYLWDDVAASAKKAYSMRYQLLTYMYGAFYLANQKGGTVARPLLFTDPSDSNARYGTALVCPARTPLSLHQLLPRLSSFAQYTQIQCTAP